MTATFFRVNLIDRPPVLSIEKEKYALACVQAQRIGADYYFLQSDLAEEDSPEHNFKKLMTVQMAGPPHLLVPPPVHSSLDELGFLPYCEKRFELYRELDLFTQQEGNLESRKDEVNHGRFADKLLADFLQHKGRVFFGPDHREHLHSFAPVYDGKQPYSLYTISRQSPNSTEPF